MRILSCLLQLALLSHAGTIYSPDRGLLSVGACSRGTLTYDNDTSPFLASSLYFNPLLAGSYTEVALAFTMIHELCRGDEILVKLPGFVLDPPPDSDVDPELLATGPHEDYSKYVARWQAGDETLTFTYTDFNPIAGKSLYPWVRTYCRELSYESERR